MGDSDRTPTQDLVAALGALTDPVKDSKANAGARSWAYLSLSGLLAAVRPILATHSLAVMQNAERVEDGVAITTILLHSSGQEWRSPTFVMPADRSPHGLKSAVTYGRRLSLETMLGVAGDDDDGVAAQQSPPPLTKPVSRVQQKASDPDPWQQPPPPPPAKPKSMGAPIPLTARPDPGSPSSTRPPSEKQTKYLWTLMRKAGMTDEEIRGWVAHKLGIEPGWHTNDLSSADVSLLIRELKPGDELPLPPEPQG